MNKSGRGACPRSGCTSQFHLDRSDSVWPASV